MDRRGGPDTVDGDDCEGDGVGMDIHVSELLLLGGVVFIGVVLQTLQSNIVMGVASGCVWVAFSALVIIYYEMQESRDGDS